METKENKKFLPNQKAIEEFEDSLKKQKVQPKKMLLERFKKGDIEKIIDYIISKPDKEIIRYFGYSIDVLKNNLSIEKINKTLNKLSNMEENLTHIWKEYNEVNRTIFYTIINYLKENEENISIEELDSVYNNIKKIFVKMKKDMSSKNKLNKNKKIDIYSVSFRELQHIYSYLFKKSTLNNDKKSIIKYFNEYKNLSDEEHYLYSHSSVLYETLIDAEQNDKTLKHEDSSFFMLTILENMPEKEIDKILKDKDYTGLLYKSSLMINENNLEKIDINKFSDKKMLLLRFLIEEESEVKDLINSPQKLISYIYVQNKIEEISRGGGSSDNNIKKLFARNEEYIENIIKDMSKTEKDVIKDYFSRNDYSNEYLDFLYKNKIIEKDYVLKRFLYSLKSYSINYDNLIKRFSNIISENKLLKIINKLLKEESISDIINTKNNEEFKFELSKDSLKNLKTFYESKEFKKDDFNDLIISNTYINSNATEDFQLLIKKEYDYLKNSYESLDEQGKENLKGLFSEVFDTESTGEYDKYNLIFKKDLFELYVNLLKQTTYPKKKIEGKKLYKYYMKYKKNNNTYAKKPNKVSYNDLKTIISLIYNKKDTHDFEKYIADQYWEETQEKDKNETLKLFDTLLDKNLYSLKEEIDTYTKNISYSTNFNLNDIIIQNYSKLKELPRKERILKINELQKLKKPDDYNEIIDKSFLWILTHGRLPRKRELHNSITDIPNFNLKDFSKVDKEMKKYESKDNCEIDDDLIVSLYNYYGKHSSKVFDIIYKNEMFDDLPSIFSKPNKEVYSDLSMAKLYEFKNNPYIDIKQVIKFLDFDSFINSLEKLSYKKEMKEVQDLCKFYHKLLTEDKDKTFHIKELKKYRGEIFDNEGLLNEQVNMLKNVSERFSNKNKYDDIYKTFGDNIFNYSKEELSDNPFFKTISKNLISKETKEIFDNPNLNIKYNKNYLKESIYHDINLKIDKNDYEYLNTFINKVPEENIDEEPLNLTDEEREDLLDKIIENKISYYIEIMKLMIDNKIKHTHFEGIINGREIKNKTLEAEFKKLETKFKNYEYVEMKDYYLDCDIKTELINYSYDNKLKDNKLKDLKINLNKYKVENLTTKDLEMYHTNRTEGMLNCFALDDRGQKGIKQMPKNSENESLFVVKDLEENKRIFSSYMWLKNKELVFDNIEGNTGFKNKDKGKEYIINGIESYRLAIKEIIKLSIKEYHKTGDFLVEKVSMANKYSKFKSENINIDKKTMSDFEKPYENSYSDATDNREEIFNVYNFIIDNNLLNKSEKEYNKIIDNYKFKGLTISTVLKRTEDILLKILNEGKEMSISSKNIEL